MKKLLLQFLILVFLFFSTLFLMNQVDWFSVFHVETLSKKAEEKISKLFLDYFKSTDKIITDTVIISTIDSLISQICTSNDIEPGSIQVHIYRNDEINAFALPNRHLVIYTALIKDAKNEAELCGVMSHEIAHLEMDHVTKKLIKEVGLATLLSMTTGNNGNLVKETARVLSSTAYDRKLEAEADARAVDYLLNAHIDPIPFADFLNRMKEEEPALQSYLVWMSTHPDSKERSDKIRKACEGKEVLSYPVLSASTWNVLKQNLHNE